MSLRLLPVSIASFGLALLAFASSANAHIRMSSPLARYDITGFDTGIKSCPCGLGTSNRTCNLATDASDPDGRSDKVTRVEAGSQLMLRFNEYVDHTGSFRVAFDPEGADMADFNDNILVPIVPDPANTGNQDWEIPVTIPNMTCDNCTLQLIQAMHGNTTTPVADPAALDTYYTCIDLEIVPPGTLGEEGTEPMGAAGSSSMGAAGSSSMGAAGSSSTGAAGSSSTNGMSANTGSGTNLGTVPMTGDNTGSGTAPAGMSSPTTAVGSLMPGAAPAGTPNLMNQNESSESGGCALGSSTLRSTGSTGWAAFGLAGVLTMLARRRRNRAA